ncbi:sulfatase [Sabulilitoribacter arenilitoris]|uniref:Sulfatase n=1 Tax=Wocania arenilitoris TaxID=2044858 RepID=A0AAE3JNA7_9FLAO|nr:sulfatase [Wocania arenilitoris]MCF7567070.1 sulfatase [Wocania arenilitoris]
MKKLNIIILFSIILLTSCYSKQKKTERENPPNLVIFFPDQWRAHAMGFMNQDPVITPNLDKLASEGIVFTNAVANYPVCSPMRAMLMTGKYPFENGVINNCMEYEGQPIYQENMELKQEEICWSDILKQKGYNLGYIGKWHLSKPKKPYIDCLNNNDKEGNKWNEWTPPNNRHGFDYWYAYNTYDYHMNPLYWSTDAKRNEFHYVDRWSPIEEADKAIKYLENKDNNYRDSSKPFALVVAMNPPHDDGVGDYKAYPKKYQKYYKDKTYTELANRPNAKLKNGEWSDWVTGHMKDYFTMVTGVDDQIGKILETLKQQKLDKNTIVLVVSDHGELMGSHNKRGKDLPYEEAMRIPLIIKYPEKLSPRKEDLMLSIPDIYPTLMGLMGFENDIPQAVSGTNFTNYLFKGEGEIPQSQLYIWVGERTNTGLRGVRTKRYTFVVNNNPPIHIPDSLLLFDNHKDPYQMKNIAYQNPKLVDSLKTVLSDWLIRTNDPYKLN